MEFPYLGELAEWFFGGMFSEYSIMGFVAGFGLCFIFSLIGYTIFKLFANIG